MLLDILEVLRLIHNLAEPLLLTVTEEQPKRVQPTLAGDVEEVWK